VYDLIHQILNGRVDGGMNRRLITTLFCEARLMHRIVEGQKCNDAERQVPVSILFNSVPFLFFIFFFPYKANKIDVCIATAQNPKACDWAIWATLH
jgi:hypothetical protein